MLVPKATILLIRHAAHAHLGQVLSGRTAGGQLTFEGVKQAQQLARHLAHETITEVHTSPVLRARETAQELAATLGTDARIDDAFNEVDFGEWTGRSFGDLARDSRWRMWNGNRAQARAPDGESMMEQDPGFDPEISQVEQVSAVHDRINISH
ncbi:histidine phosphatase family protein [Allopontixanthobacter sp.]|uniref:histidine phosphatase family protein n=1 Tax=Allopontixanthobacter sp. TaxID=2906452 RepID=UPI002ABB7FEF|nr:histidine phosphatase family protein [Allopontixanthobacter sp.]MDZ4308105.1 histidine phosphatase family protein [Allopontixanthobacter sp.]